MRRLGHRWPWVVAVEAGDSLNSLLSRGLPHNAGNHAMPMLVTNEAPECLQTQCSRYNIHGFLGSQQIERVAVPLQQQASLVQVMNRALLNLLP